MADTVERAAGLGHRLAIVGSGPSGLYAARAASNIPQFEEIDVIDALPTPYGLVRYGIAPDHPTTKRVTRVFDKMFDSGRVGFIGNVTVGREVTHEQLLRHYDRVIYATGMSGAKRVEVPGAHLPGSVSAAEFVSWYSGHPDASCPLPESEVSSVVVIGGGNVALDVVRLLACLPDRLRATDMPDDVLQEFLDSRVRDIHLLVRRGPEDAQFSPVVLKELAHLEHVRVEVVKEDLDCPATGGADVSAAAKENCDLLSQWVEAAHTPDERLAKLHFWTKPVRMVGDVAVTGVVVVAERPGSEPKTETIPAQLVVHCVGFSADDHHGLPIDPGRGTVRHDRGRVMSASGDPMERAYVVGWLKRGPQGVVATNRADAEETVGCVVEDLSQSPDIGTVPRLVDALRSAGVAVVDWAGWRAIEEQERSEGRRRDADSIKVSQRSRMVEIATRGASVLEIS